MRKGFAAKRVAATAMAVAMTTMSLAGCSSGNKEGTTKAEETAQAASGKQLRRQLKQQREKKMTNHTQVQS